MIENNETKSAPKYEDTVDQWKAEQRRRCDIEDLTRWSSLLTYPIEVRIITKGYAGKISGYFDNADALVKAVIPYSGRNDRDCGQIEAIYCTLNPVGESLLARAYNRLKHKAKATTKDNQITRRVWLPIDVDANRAAEIMATHAERQVTLETAHKIRMFLSGFGFPEPLLADSGNGTHLLYRIDLPNLFYGTDIVEGEHVDGKDAIRDAIKEFLKQLHKRWPPIDRGVFNAARIFKVYGTLVAKGDELGERLHRKARLIEVPEKLEIVPLELIEAVNEFCRSQSNGHDSTHWVDELRAEQNQRSGAPFDIETFFEQHQIEHRGETEHEGGSKWVLAQCPFNGDHAAPDAAVFKSAEGVLGFKCFHDSCVDNHWQEFRRHFEPEYVGRDETDEADESTDDTNTEEQPKAQRSTSEFRRGYLVRDLLNLPKPRWAIEDHITCGGFSVVYGPYDCGKTFVALDMALCLSEGKAFLDKYKTEPMSVVYVAGEGHQGILKRISAWSQHYGINLDAFDNFVLIPSQFDLMDAREPAKIIQIATEKLGRLPQAIFFDTLSKMIGGGAHSDSKDMGTYCNNVARCQRLAGEETLAVSIHHCGKDASLGPLGSVVLPGASDTIIEMSGSVDSAVNINCYKQKDAPPFESYRLRSQHYSVPFDEMNRGSVVLIPSQGFSADLTPTQRLLADILHKRYGTQPFEWKNGLMTSGWDKSKYNRHLTALVEKGFLDRRGEAYELNAEAMAKMIISGRGSDGSQD